jgi:hypothetical protein
MTMQSDCDNKFASEMNSKGIEDRAIVEPHLL